MVYKGELSRNCGHYFFHTLFRDAIQRGGLFNDLLGGICRPRASRQRCA
jgi:hypothetical protein